MFGISIDSFRIAGGSSGGDHRHVDDQRQVGEDKQNKQEKSESAIRESIGVVPLALPLMAGPGAISSTIVWSSRYHNWQSLLGFTVAIALFAFLLLAVVPRRAAVGAFAWADRHQRDHPNHGPVADGARDRVYRYRH